MLSLIVLVSSGHDAAPLFKAARDLSRANNVSVLRWLKPMPGQAEAKRLLAECAQSVQTVQRLSRGEGSQLNIGYDANIYHDLLPATLGAFQKACPRPALQFCGLYQDGIH